MASVMANRTNGSAARPEVRFHPISRELTAVPDGVRRSLSLGFENRMIKIPDLLGTYVSAWFAPEIFSVKPKGEANMNISIAACMLSMGVYEAGPHKGGPRLRAVTFPNPIDVTYKMDQNGDIRVLNVDSSRIVRTYVERRFLDELLGLFPTGKDAEGEGAARIDNQSTIVEIGALMGRIAGYPTEALANVFDRILKNPGNEVPALWGRTYSNSVFPKTVANGRVEGGIYDAYPDLPRPLPATLDVVLTKP